MLKFELKINKLLILFFIFELISILLRSSNGLPLPKKKEVGSSIPPLTTWKLKREN
jgi:hypothetical protein